MPFVYFDTNRTQRTIQGELTRQHIDEVLEENGTRIIYIKEKQKIQWTGKISIYPDNTYIITDENLTPERKTILQYTLEESGLIDRQRLQQQQLLLSALTNQTPFPIPAGELAQPDRLLNLFSQPEIFDAVSQNSTLQLAITVPGEHNLIEVDLSLDPRKPGFLDKNGVSFWNQSINRKLRENLLIFSEQVINRRFIQQIQLYFPDIGEIDPALPQLKDPNTLNYLVCLLDTAQSEESQQRTETQTQIQAIMTNNDIAILLHAISTTFDGVDLTDKNFQYAILPGWPIPKGTKFTNSNFSHASLQAIVLAGCILENVNFSYAYLEEAQLNDSNLRNTNFSGANLKYANLKRTDLRGADLRGADLRGAQLDANINWASIEFDENTKFDRAYVDQHGSRMINQKVEAVKTRTDLSAEEKLRIIRSAMQGVLRSMSKEKKVKGINTEIVEASLGGVIRDTINRQDPSSAEKLTTIKEFLEVVVASHISLNTISDDLLRTLVLYQLSGEETKIDNALTEIFNRTKQAKIFPPSEPDSPIVGQDLRFITFNRQTIPQSVWLKGDVDFSFADLSGLRFIQPWMSLTQSGGRGIIKFNYTNCQGVNFKGSIFHTHVEAHHANFERADLSNTLFHRGIDLTGASLSYANLSGTKLGKNAILDHVNWTGVILDDETDLDWEKYGEDILNLNPNYTDLIASKKSEQQNKEEEESRQKEAEETHRQEQKELFRSMAKAEEKSLGEAIKSLQALDFTWTNYTPKRELRKIASITGLSLESRMQLANTYIQTVLSKDIPENTCRHLPKVATLEERERTRELTRLFSSFQSLKSAVEISGSKHLKNLYLPEFDLSEMDLSDLTLEDCDFRKSSLTGSNLKNMKGTVKLSDADLSNAHLEGTTLKAHLSDNFANINWAGIHIDAHTQLPWNKCGKDIVVQNLWHFGRMELTPYEKAQRANQFLENIPFTIYKDLLGLQEASEQSRKDVLDTIFNNRPWASVVQSQPPEDRLFLDVSYMVHQKKTIKSFDCKNKKLVYCNFSYLNLTYTSFNFSDLTGSDFRRSPVDNASFVGTIFSQETKIDGRKYGIKIFMQNLNALYAEPKPSQAQIERIKSTLAFVAKRVPIQAIGKLKTAEQIIEEVAGEEGAIRFSETANLSGAILSNLTFRKPVILRGGNLRGANLRRSTFKSKVDLTDIDLRDTDLTGVNFRDYVDWQGVLLNEDTKLDWTRYGDEIIRQNAWILYTQNLPEERKARITQTIERVQEKMRETIPVSSQSPESKIDKTVKWGEKGIRSILDELIRIGTPQDKSINQRKQLEQNQQYALRFIKKVLPDLSYEDLLELLDEIIRHEQELAYLRETRTAYIWHRTDIDTKTWRSIIIGIRRELETRYRAELAKQLPKDEEGRKSMLRQGKIREVSSLSKENPLLDRWTSFSLMMEMGRGPFTLNSLTRRRRKLAKTNLVKTSADYTFSQLNETLWRTKKQKEKPLPGIPQQPGESAQSTTIIITEIGGKTNTPKPIPPEKSSETPTGTPNRRIFSRWTRWPGSHDKKATSQPLLLPEIRV